MLINNCSRTAQILKAIDNPNQPIGTLIEEIPADLGRSYNGYKRGGAIEGLEKLRKELFTALVWMFGIPGFNAIGNFICEKYLNIPTSIDYSTFQLSKGNDAIKDSISFLTTGQYKNNQNVSKYMQYSDKYLLNNKTYPKIFDFLNSKIQSQNASKIKSATKIANGNKEIEQYLTQGILKDGTDVSELMKYGKKFISNKTDIENTINSLIQQTRGAKQVTSVLAIVLNCIAMGIVIPKINQKITSKKLEKENNKAINDELQKTDTLKNKQNNITFKGDIVDSLVFNAENNSRFRLLVTDIPMIIGRMITSRNKFEALEYLVMDSTSAYFYNFSNQNIQDLIRNKMHYPCISSSSLELINNNQEQLEKALEYLRNNPELKKYKASPKENILKVLISKIQNNKNDIVDIDTSKLHPENILKQFFDDDMANLLYKEGTYGKFGKINRYTSIQSIEEINENVISYLNYLNKNKVYKNRKLNTNLLNTLSKKIKSMNTKSHIAGLGISIIGLAVIIPKMTFLLTRLITGKNEFVGTANYDDLKKKSNTKTTTDNE